MGNRNSGRSRKLSVAHHNALVRLYFIEKWKQVTLANHYRVSQSTVARIIAEGVRKRG